MKKKKKMGKEAEEEELDSQVLRTRFA